MYAQELFYHMQRLCMQHELQLRLAGYVRLFSIWGLQCDLCALLMMSRHNRLALWEAFRRIPPSAPHGSNHAAWLLTSALARTGRYQEFHVFLEPENGWALELPPQPPSEAFGSMALPSMSDLYSAIYLSGNHYVVGNKVFLLRPLHDWVPIVCEIGTSHAPKQWASLLCALLSGTLRETDVLIFKATATRRIYEQAWRAWRTHFPGIKQPKFVVLPNGIDTEENHRDESLRKETRAALRIADDRVIFLCFSRIEQSTKGDQRSLVALWRQVLRRAPGATLVISGRGDLGTVANMCALARQCEVADRVVILPNPYDLWPNAKQRLMSAADVFVHMTTGVEETFPLTTLEGMSHGLPLIGTHWAGIPELVVDGQNGFLVDTRAAPLPETLRVGALALSYGYEYLKQLSSNVTHDAQQFINAVVRLSNDRILRERMSASARETVLERHRIEDMAAKRVEVLEEASRIAQQAGPPPPRTLLLDPDWILSAMATDALDDKTRLVVVASDAATLIPEVEEATIRSAVEVVLRFVEEHPHCDVESVVSHARRPLVELGFMPVENATETRAVVQRLIVRLMNYGAVTIPVSDRKNGASAPAPGLHHWGTEGLAI